MSRSFSPRRSSKNYWRCRRRLMILDERSTRRAVRTELVHALEDAGWDEETAEVLADFHEEHGRPRVAELLRRGRRELPLPGAGRHWNCGKR